MDRKERLENLNLSEKQYRTKLSDLARTEGGILKAGKFDWSLSFEKL